MRRSRDSGVKFDSFPFLNVMIGMIVILLLFMLMIVTTRAMTADAARHDAQVVAATLAAPAPSAENGEPGNSDLSEEDLRRLIAEVERLEELAVQQRQRLEDLRAMKSEIENLLLAKQDEINLATLSGDGEIGGYLVGEPDPTVMIPDSSVAVSKTPRFVEINAEQYIFHAESGPKAFPVAELEPQSAMDAELQRADANRESQYLLLLVHPNGAEAHDKLRAFLREHYVEKISIPSPNPLERWYRLKIRIPLGIEPFAPEWLLIAKPQP